MRLGDFSQIKELKGQPAHQRWTKFDTDVAAEQLPNVSWMLEGADGNDVA